MTEEKKNESSDAKVTDSGGKKPEGQDVASKPTLAPVKKSRKKFWIVLFVVILLILVTRQGIRSYYGGSNSKDITIPDNLTNENSGQTVNNNSDTATTTNTNSKKTNKNGNASTPAPSSQPDAPGDAFDPLEFFVEVATTYQTKAGTTERWVKNTVYLGGNPADFASVDPIYTECMNQFVADFNSASTTVKLQRNDALADIKIYWFSDEQMEQYAGDMNNSGFAHNVTNASGEITGAEIYMKKSYSNLDSMKCLLIRHEIYHTVGFAHSDQHRESLMGMPSQGNNDGKALRDVDKRAIRMLYSSGLPLKQTADQIRQYFSTHSY